MPSNISLNASRAKHMFFKNPKLPFIPSLFSSQIFFASVVFPSSLLRYSSSSPLTLKTEDLLPSRSSPMLASTIRCSSRSHAYVPKLEPFSRTKLERAVKVPPLIEKSEKELTDYCSTVDGDDSYSCWRAYFELKDIEKESPKEDVEKLILEAGGVKSLIGCLHSIASMLEQNKNGENSRKTMNAIKERERCQIPDGLPKSAEEIEEEERARMLDSPFTRLLRTKGRFPAWYSHAPNHKND